MTPRSRASMGWVSLGCVLVWLAGCATMDRQQLLERGAAAITYRLPPERLLEVARELLLEEGYALVPSTDPLYVRTAWRVKFDDTLDIGGLRQRHFVLVKRLDEGLCTVNVYRMSSTSVGRTAPHPVSSHVDEKTGTQKMTQGDPMSPGRPVLERDLELEWRLLSRLSPATAHALESQVDVYLAQHP
ncbi:hypothetical protein [Melittangium boletus]|uniref:hypothetical protein n=1 Tax=Melittangium boletus TaxID=83453 RepID=UPI003DA534CB